MILLLFALFSSDISRVLADTSRWASPNRMGTVNAAVSSHLFLGDDSILVGGKFTRAGDGPALHIALWDGTAWRPFGLGANGVVQALARDSAGGIIVAGMFDSIGGIAAPSSLARFHDGVWTPFLTDSALERNVPQVLVEPDGSIAAVRGTGCVERWKDGNRTVAATAYGNPDPVQIRLLGGRLHYWGARTPLFAMRADSGWDSISRPTWRYPTDVLLDVSGSLLLLEQGSTNIDQYQRLWKRVDTTWQLAGDSLKQGALLRLARDPSGRLWGVGEVYSGRSHGLAWLEGGKWTIPSWSKILYYFGSGLVDVEMDAKGRIWGFGSVSDPSPTNTYIPAWYGLTRITSDTAYGLSQWHNEGPSIASSSGSDPLPVHSSADTVWTPTLGANSRAYVGMTSRPAPMPSATSYDLRIAQGETSWVFNNTGGIISRVRDTSMIPLLRIARKGANSASLHQVFDLGTSGVAIVGSFDSVRAEGASRWTGAQNIAVLRGDTVVPLDTVHKAPIPDNVQVGASWNDTLLLSPDGYQVPLYRCIVSQRRCDTLLKYTGGAYLLVHDPVLHRTLFMGRFGYPYTPGENITDNYLLLDDSSKTLRSVPGTLGQIFEKVVPDGEGGFVLSTRSIGTFFESSMLAHMDSQGRIDTVLRSDAWGILEPGVIRLVSEIQGIARSASGDLHLFGMFALLGGKVLPLHAVCTGCLAPIAPSAPPTTSARRSVPKTFGPIVHLYDMRGQRYEPDDLSKRLFRAGIYLGVDASGQVRRFVQPIHGRLAAPPR